MNAAARIDLARAAPGGVLVAGDALAGTHGVSRVEVRPLLASGQGARVQAELHLPPLGGGVWVQWQVFLPGLAAPGARVEARAVDGTGHPQSEEKRGPFPSGASGLHSLEVGT